MWHEHKNMTRQNAFLYSVTDEPTMRKLGLFREEGKTAEGKVLPVAACLTQCVTQTSETLRSSSNRP